MLADGTLRVLSGKVEIGQHIGHALSLIVADELDLPLHRVQLLPADTACSPDEGYTSGSNSLQHSGTALRLAAATARRILVQRAAASFGVAEHDVVCADGMLRNTWGNQAINFAEAMAGRGFEAPVAIDAITKRADELHHVGAPAPASALAGIVTGAAEFVHDLSWANMLHARVVRPPHYHARLMNAPHRVQAAEQSFDVIRDGSFIAIAGAPEFDVVRAAERLERQVEWADGPGLNTGDVFEQLRTGPRQSRSVVAGTPVEGEVTPHPPWPHDAAQVLAARFERSYQMHASIGPSAAAALFDGGKLTLWSATQGIFPLRGALARTLALDPADVRVIHVPGAGCYGHNGADDAALDAALVARACAGRHVLLKWTRAQEHTWEPYAPCMAVGLQAALDETGQIIGWRHDGYSDTHLARPRSGPDQAGPSRLLAARHIENAAPLFRPVPSMARHAGIHRNADPLYIFEQRSIAKHLVGGLPLRTSAMRTLGAFANVFAIESFIDELAAVAGADPLAYRLRHLRDERAGTVLRRVAAAARWPGRALAAGEALGLGLAQYKNAQAYAAVCARLRVDDAAVVHLEHLYIAADAGRVVDPDGLAAQLEGGAVQGASWALFEAVEYGARGISSVDWEGYRIARFEDLPPLTTELINRPGEPPLGAGEASSGPAGAAIANAIARACGVRPRRMPFTPYNLRLSAMRD